MKWKLDILAPTPVTVIIAAFWLTISLPTQDRDFQGRRRQISAALGFRTLIGRCGRDAVVKLRVAWKNKINQEYVKTIDKD